MKLAVVATTLLAVATAMPTTLSSTSKLSKASELADRADLGGNCCPDTEERIAELEETTPRKGNRVVETG